MVYFIMSNILQTTEELNQSSMIGMGLTAAEDAIYCMSLTV